MRRLLLLFFVLQTARGACPDGFKLAAGGQCMQLTPLSVTYKDSDATNLAISKCYENRTNPIIINYAEQQSYWAPKASTRLILGIVCNTTSLKWQWSDGSPIDYKPPSYNGGMNSNCASGCVWFMSNTAGYWDKWCDGDSTAFSLYCTVQLPQPIYSEDGCEYFQDDTDDGVCYQVGQTAETWNDAQVNCKKLGANLASIHNQQENNFLRRLAVSQGAVSGVFIGATISGKDNKFGWIDGTDWDYQNFYPGFPLTGFGDCVALDSSTSAGQWLNFDCSGKLPVACIRDKQPNIVANYSCSGGPFAENTLITSPGFPYNASTPCDFFLMAEDGKKVELEIVHLEANPCCDNLVLYDGYLGATLMNNLTGIITNATYTTTQTNYMRVSWQPKGGYNVMGLAMSFRSV